MYIGENKFSSPQNSYKCTRIHNVFTTVATECVPLLFMSFETCKTATSMFVCYLIIQLLSDFLLLFFLQHFWTEFAINEIIQVLEASQFFVVVYSAAHQMQSVKRQNHKLSEVKIFFVHMGKGLTHHRLHNHITKNIFTNTTF